MQPFLAVCGGMICGVVLCLIGEPALGQPDEQPDRFENFRRQMEERGVILGEPNLNLLAQPLQRLPPGIPRGRNLNGAPFSCFMTLDDNSHLPQFRLVLRDIGGAELSNQLQLDDQQAERVVRYYVDQCTDLCKKWLDVCELSHAQFEKLNATAVVDATRLLRRVRSEFAGTTEQQIARGMDPLRLQHEANRELAQGINRPESLFRKVLSTVISPEQRARLYRIRAESLCDEIDRHAVLSLEAQRRLLKVDYPPPGEQPELYTRLKPEQREKLLALIVGNDHGKQELIELVDPLLAPNLLEDIGPEDLVEFLSPPQVQAVLRQQAMVQSRRNYIESVRGRDQARDVMRLRVIQGVFPGFQRLP